MQAHDTAPSMLQRLREALPWLPRLTLALAALLASASVIVFALRPPTRKDVSDHPRLVYNTKLFLNGQLGLIAIWAALGTTPWSLRWGGAAIAFVLTSRAVESADPALSTYFFQPWELATAALLTFTVLTVFRAAGLHITATKAALGATPAVWQFSLRRMFAWVAMVAALSCAWKYWLSVEAQRKLGWPLFSTNVWAFMVSAAVTDAGMALVAVLATLRRKPLRWWMLLLVPIVVLLQTAIMEGTFLATNAAVARPSYQSISYCCRNDLVQLAPLVTVLLLARAAGYRLVWGGEGGGVNRASPVGTT